MHAGSLARSPSISLHATCTAVVVLLALYACLFRLGAPTLEHWDEARLANSALEMLHNGRWLTPYFDGAPDHWSTKPPLVIWLMVASLDLLGTSDWSARLPASLCAVALIVAVHAWTARETASPVTGLIAALCLIATPGFLLEHGARAAEYDAPLALATTGTVYAAWRWTEDGRATARWAPALMAVCVLCGVMTKTVQALVVLPPLALWWVACPTRPRVATRWVVLPWSTVLVAVVLYGLLRHAEDPGYLAATWHNDIAGRFGDAQEGHRGDAFWYFRRLKSYPLLLPAIAGWAWAFPRLQGRSRRMALLLGLVSAGYLLVISLSETKLRWYALPTVPWTAMIFALALRAAWLPRHAGATGGVSKRYGAPPIQRCGASALIAALTLVSLHVAYHVEHRATEQKRTPTHAVDHFLRANGHALPPDEGIAVLQPGVISPHTREPYAAPTLFYVLALRWQGLRIDMIHTERELRPEHRIVVRCRPASTLLDAAQPRHAPLDCHAQRRNALQ